MKLSDDIQRLKDILSNVNELQRFAEAKHGSLIAISIAIIGGLLNVMNKAQGDISIRFFCITSAILFMVSVFVSLRSFYPCTGNGEKIENIDCDKVNLYFFGHIKKFTTESYLREMQKCYDTSLQLTSSYEAKDLANQVIVNARITQYKFDLFKTAVTLFCIAGGLASFIFIYKL
ncbi:Pycsar system effector family protein [Halodesulfovibrio aestuarii]|uniref:Pycsar system effector family protein n=1 Tax=Halodesulfovibrio aestuarii TaxID=126333 RepID=UPI000419E616